MDEGGPERQEHALVPAALSVRHQEAPRERSKTSGLVILGSYKTHRILQASVKIGARRPALIYIK